MKIQMDFVLNKSILRCSRLSGYGLQLYNIILLFLCHYHSADMYEYFPDYLYQLQRKNLINESSCHYCFIFFFFLLPSCFFLLLLFYFSFPFPFIFSFFPLFVQQVNLHFCGVFINPYTKNKKKIK